MTQYPEVLFARELGLCYAVMVSITIGTWGWHGSLMPLIPWEVLEIFRRNTQITQRALVSLVGRCQTFDCACAATTTSEYYKAA